MMGTLRFAHPTEDIITEQRRMGKAQRAHQQLFEHFVKTRTI